MATGDLLGDDDIDAMLRDLLDEPTVATGWETFQRSRLLAHIAHGDASTDEGSSGNGPVRVVVLHQHARTEPAGRSRRLAAGAAAAALVVVGALATVRLSGDPSSDAPAASDSSSIATGTFPATTAAIATSNGWPSLLPAIAPAEGETVTASIGEVAVENPRMTTAVVARVEGSSVRDVVHIVAVDTAPYLARMERFYDATEVMIDGLTVTAYEVKGNLAGGSPMVVVPYDDNHSVVVRGADPVGFLSLIGTSFASIIDDASSAGPLTLRLDQLPTGYELVAGPQAMVPGALLPSLRLARLDGSVVADISQVGPEWPFPDSPNIVRTEDGRYWRSDSKFGSQLTWPIGDGQWLVMSNIFGANDETPATLEEALAIADRIELVDRDTWLARYPDAIDGGAPATTLAPEDLEAAPAATEEVPVVDGDLAGPRVLVANASTVTGAARMLTVQLDAEFQMLPAVNSGEPNPRDRSAVYYQPGSIDTATALADRIGGADVLPMPDELPIEGGNDALLGPDIVDGHGSIDILVMLANDHAREIQDRAGP